MKMKKLLIITTMLVVGAAQADQLWWADTVLTGFGASPDGVSFDLGDNWYDATTGAWKAPGLNDDLFIQDFTLGFPTPNMPTISNNQAVNKPNFLFLGWDAGTSGTLNFASGGHLETGLSRVGNGIGATGTLNMMDGWTYMNATTVLEVGYNLLENIGTPTNNLISSGNGVVNLGANATLHAYGFLFGQESAHFGLSGTNGTANGQGQINMYGGGDGIGARFIVAGNLIAAEGGDGRADTWLANGWVDAPTVGESILATYDAGNDWTEFNVIPEPATLGMVTILGGGILWIRKRFMI